MLVKSDSQTKICSVNMAHGTQINWLKLIIPMGFKELPLLKNDVWDTDKLDKGILSKVCSVYKLENGAKRVRTCALEVAGVSSKMVVTASQRPLLQLLLIQTYT